LAKKINYYGYTRLNGVLLDDVKTHLVYLRGTSRDSLRLSTQNIIVNASVTDVPLTVSLKPDAVFTYFFLQDTVVDSNVSIKINDGTVAFKISPDLWLEDDILSATITNSSVQKFSITVVQLFAEGAS